MEENKKTGYLTVNKSKGKEYLVLRRSKRVKKNGKSVVAKEQLFSFGSLPAAIESMYDMRDQKIEFPNKLKEHGYTFDDLDEWILTVETKVTKTGKKMCI